MNNFYNIKLFFSYCLISLNLALDFGIPTELYYFVQVPFTLRKEHGSKIDAVLCRLMENGTAYGLLRR